MLVIWVIVWVIMAFIIAGVAKRKGRSAFGWFIYGFLIWPLALVHVLVTAPNARVVEAAALRAGEGRKCPHCAEIVKREATVCRFCQRDLPPIENAVPRIAG